MSSSAPQERGQVARRTFGVLHSCDEVALGERADVLVYAAVTEAGYLDNELGGDNFVVL